MKKIWVIGLVAIATMGCWAAAFPASNLNRLQLGWTTDQFLSYWGSGKGIQPIRRAIRASAGDTVQVFTMPMKESTFADDVPYWFVFRNGHLAQWGRPEDWKSVAATYQIDFNPAPAVRPPA